MGVVLFAVCVVAVRVVIEGRAELRAGRAAAAEDLPGAITHLGRAARWYAPGASAPADALDDLRTIGLTAEGHGDSKLALDAWQTVRGAILSTRSTYTPHADRLEEANEHIATLMAQTEPATVAPGQTQDQRRSWHLDLLERDDAPKVGWTLLALLGLGGWIAAAFLFIYRAVGEDDRLKARTALACGLAIVAGFGAFLFGLARA